MKISATGFTLETLPSDTESLDVYFDNDRVWSLDTRGTAAHTPLTASWPEALKPFLHGSTLVSLRNSKTQNVIASHETQFSHSQQRVRIVDASGRPLAINKWGRLGRTLDGLGTELQQQILRQASTIIEQLLELNLQPFIVGGTLLGAVRDSALLPHDDDADIAYLSRFTTPVDVATEGLQLAQKLAALGYEVVAHSATHQQLIFRDSDHTITHYIDVFAAFFDREGMINQPFHVRGKMRSDELVPFGTTDISGHTFPVPASPDRWLTINYDSNWRTPIPGFLLETPQSTSRRFENWFGSFQRSRDFWEEFYAPARNSNTHALTAHTFMWDAGRRWLAEQTQHFSAPVFIDLGCGSGELTRTIAAQHQPARVIGVDYSDHAITQARNTSAIDTPPQPEYLSCNIERLQTLATIATAAGAPFNITANFLVEALSPHARKYFWRLVRMSLRSGGTAAFTFHAQHAADVSIEDPTGWHLSESDAHTEAAQYGLSLTTTPLISERMSPRSPTGAVAHLAHSPLQHSDSSALRPVHNASNTHRNATTGAPTMTPPASQPHSSLSARLRALRPVTRKSFMELQRALAHEQERVATLQQEIDALRHDHLRVAELITLVESSLTPPKAE